MRVLKVIVLFLLVFCTLAVTVVCAAVATGDYTPAVKNTEQNKTRPQTVRQAETVSESCNANTETTNVQTDEYITVAKQEVTKEYIPRLTAPEKTNKYYYSGENVFYQSGWGIPNCTAYAWGRAYEILNEEPKLSTGDANDWYDYNKENECYSYGYKPKLGAIACFSYTDRDSGHVAVVEKIEEDKIYFSNSAWEGSEFYTNITPIEDPSADRETWLFQGYIYIDEPL